MIFWAIIIVIILLYIKYFQQQRSLLLDIVDGQLTKFFMHLSNKYFIGPSPYSKAIYVPNIKLLMDRFSFSNIHEINIGNKDTAYTINKKYIYICLKNLPYENVYNINTIMFVILHELTHLSNNSWNHTSEFWKLFKFYILEAMEAKVYVPVDYAQYPEKYCHTEITYNPVFDKDLYM